MKIYLNDTLNYLVLIKYILNIQLYYNIINLV